MNTVPGHHPQSDGHVPFLPIPVAELELSATDPAPEPNSLGQIVLLVRMHGVPLGTMALLDEHRGGAVDLQQLATTRFAAELREHLRRDGHGAEPTPEGARAVPRSACTIVGPTSPRPATVIVCTLGEDPRLLQTVQSVLAQTHTALELLVVDNNPASGRVPALLAEVTDPRLRVVEEPRRGLSVARNAGLAAAGSPVVAFTDDDAYADPEWLHHLLAPFEEHPAVACVTGLVLPAELRTEAQRWFEEFGAFDKGFERVVWRTTGDARLDALGTVGEGGALFPYSAGVYGSGNNMAFRAEWLQRHGTFDEALGAGTVARGGEDIDAFLRVMLSGEAIVYEPRALVRHHARADMAGLRTQMYGYGSGMCAVIVKHFVSSPRGALGIVARLPAGLRKLLDPGSDKNEAKTTAFPKELVRAELLGFAAGPLLYVRSRLRSHRSSRLPARQG